MKEKTSTTPHSLNRRDFLKTSAVFGAVSIVPSYVVLGQKSNSGQLAPSEKVNVACIGVMNRGGANMSGVEKTGLANFVALCDVDIENNRARKKISENPKAKLYSDWRVMFDEMGDSIDAVLISTPDHAHFCMTMQAMAMGKHVYTEKPLAHTYGQCERLIQMADKNPGVVTQMGNQGHSGGNYFQFKAWTEAGIVKDVSRITATMNSKRRWHAPDWISLTSYPEETVPGNVDWDLWLDSAPVQPYSDRLHPGNWR